MKVKLDMGEVFSGEALMSLLKICLKSLFVRLMVEGFLGRMRLMKNFSFSASLNVYEIRFSIFEMLLMARDVLFLVICLCSVI